MLKQWQFKSSSGSGTYTLQLHDDLHFSCNCMAWRMKKKDQARTCKHIKEVIMSEGLQVEARGEHQFVVGNKEVPAQTAAQTETRIPEQKPDNGNDGYIQPMLAAAMPPGRSIDSFNDSKIWVAEEKFDGHRKVVSIGDEIKAWSRPKPGTRQGLESPLPAHIKAVLKDLPVGVYDGELVIRGGHAWDVVAGSNSGKERLIIFDMLKCLDQPIIKKPFRERRELLEVSFDVFRGVEMPVELSQLYQPSKALAEEIWARGGEGLVLKRWDSMYRPGDRPDTWIKVKQKSRAILTIVGFQTGENGPYSTILLMGADGSKTKVKTLNNDWLREFEKNADAYLGKGLVIEYQGRTPAGNWRHPMAKQIVMDHVASAAEGGK